ncbi:MAG: DNA repair protein RecO [Nitrospirota bacterium]|nr:DNA repair protein RecO [Nitrospirota bacterium]
MALVTTDAVIVKSQRWGEADRIVTFFTVRLGKVRGIARGARLMKSRFGGGLEPFTCVRLTVFDRRNDALASISNVDILESFFSLRDNLERMSAAARMVTLVEAVTAERDPSPVLFFTIREGLRSLQTMEDAGLLTLVFQIHVLGQTGFRPQIDHCASCGGGLFSVGGRFAPSAGGLVCAHCERTGWDRCLPMSPGSVAFVQQARRMKFSLATRLKADGQVREELEKITTAYISVVVGKRLPALDFLVAEPQQVPYGTGQEDHLPENK